MPSSRDETDARPREAEHEPGDRPTEQQHGRRCDEDQPDRLIVAAEEHQTHREATSGADDLTERQRRQVRGTSEASQQRDRPDELRPDRRARDHRPAPTRPIAPASPAADEGERPGEDRRDPQSERFEEVARPVGRDGLGSFAK